MKSDKSTHILNASSNLLGICFVVLTSMKLLKLNETTYIDELTAVTMFSLMISCILSFLSIRSTISSQAKRFETIADLAFLAGLTFMFFATMMITFDIVV